jgi:hypothetical protein
LSVKTFHLEPNEVLDRVHTIIFGLAVIWQAAAVSAMVDFHRFHPNPLKASDVDESNGLDVGNRIIL